MKRKFLVVITIGILFSIVMGSCSKKDNSNTMNETNKSNPSQVSRISGEMYGKEINTPIEAEYTYSKITKIPIENHIENIKCILGKDDMLYGAGVTYDDNGDLISCIFSVDIESLSVNYYLNFMDVGKEIIDIAVNAENEIFFTSFIFDTQTSNDFYSVNRIDSDGNINLSFELNKYMSSDDYLEIRGIVLDDLSNIYIQTGSTLLVFDREGTLIFDIGLADKFYDKLFSLYNGVVVIPVFNDEGGTTLYTINTETEKLEELKILSEEYAVTSGFGEDTELLIFNGNTLNTQSLENSENDFILNWLSIDYDSSRISNLCAVSPDKLAFLFIDSWDRNITEITVLTKAKMQANPKTIVTLATLFPDTDLVSKFNRSNENYRIEVIDYSEYIVGNDYSVAIDNFKLDILAGNTPDLFDFYLMEYEDFAKIDILADLYGYFANDNTINIDSFVEGSLEALAINGELFAVTPGFRIRTIVGLSSIVDSEFGLSLDELIQLEKELPEGMKLFNNMFDSLFLDLYCTVNLENFIDYENNYAHFDSEEFIRALNLASKFDSNLVKSEENAVLPLLSDEDSMKHGESALSYREFHSMINLYILEVDSVGRDLSVVGIPSNTKIGSIMLPAPYYGICNGTENPEGAWDFIKYLLSEDHQRTLSGNYFPILESLYHEEFEILMAPRIRNNDPNLGESYPEMTQEQADEIFKMISTSRADQPNPIIMNIIYEETSAYFSGDKNVEETVDIINNKVEVYLRERS